MFWAGLWAAAATDGARMILGQFGRHAALALALTVITVAQLGDAQIKNLLDRLTALVSSGGTGGISGQIILNTYILNTTGWQRMSANATLPANTPGGRETVIEIYGEGLWRNGAGTNLSFALALTNPAQNFAEAKVVATTLNDNQPFSYHVIAVLTIFSAGSALMHVSFSVSPRLTDPATGQSAPANTVTAEGTEIQLVGFTGGIQTQWFIAGAWQAQAGTVTTAVSHRTQITRYGF
jgi:hypothetical protein